ncbi:MAG TPA: pyrroline-5-carboxylate reductase [Tepidisphaeraceae bacterium]|nr:pyrroline-5-carboxylate reductase [Tepidisphaeraceae bacterium]
MQYELGIIGAGQMAEAIVRGVIRGGLFEAGQMIAADVSDARRDVFHKELGLAVSAENADVARQSKAVLLSVKPYQMAEVLAGIGRVMAPGTLVISIAAGVKAASIEKHLGAAHAWRVVRSMPNTPMLVGEGMVAIAAGTHATPADLAAARRIFEASADVLDVREDQIDAVTAMSGSGPAYFFYFVEAMIKAGQELGLSAEQAHKLASKTCLGAGRMLTLSADSPEELRRKVTTPNGTTHAAIVAMQGKGLGDIVAEGVRAAERRSKELGA